MSGREFVFDPRMFISHPFHGCPRCGKPELGTLSLANNFHHRRCRNCRYEEAEHLPGLKKRLIYLDQMLLSNVAKELDPVWRARTKRRDPFWLDVFDQLDKLVKLQLIVCPESPVHAEESAYDDRVEAVLRRLYKHLASGVTLDFPFQVHQLQIWEALSAVNEERDPARDRLTADEIIHGDLDQWSERILLTVNMGHLDGEIDSRRAARAKSHATLVLLWDQWKLEKNVSFMTRFEHERRGFAQGAVEAYIGYLWRTHRIQSGAESLSDPLALMPGPAVMLIRQLSEHLQKEHDSFEDSLNRVREFLNSEPVLQAPKNHIAALLFASLARQAASGKKNPPSQGTSNDVEVISAYLPYCDAMFIDDEFAQILREGPVDKEIAIYPTRVFSNRSKKEFLNYLREIEADAPKDHVALVARTYGDDWVTPYRSLLEHEREKDEPRGDGSGGETSAIN
jgi:hypothetical protein